MNSSEAIDKLATALHAAQSEMGGAEKGAANPFFKSKYADLTSVIMAVKGPFTKHGISYIQAPVSEDGKVGVTTRLMHVSGQWLEETLLVPLVKQDPQAAGSALTYARRYALQSFAGIPAVDDDGEAAMLRTAEVPKYTVEQFKAFHDIFEDESAVDMYLFRLANESAYIELTSSFEKGTKTANKKMLAALEAEGCNTINTYVQQVEDAAEAQDLSGVAEILGDLEGAAKQLVWDRVANPTKSLITELKKAA
jgi:hypothetical protein